MKKLVGLFLVVTMFVFSFVGCAIQPVLDELKELGVKSVDYLIASHADADHIGGLLKVLEVYEVKNIFRPFQIAGTVDNADSFIPNEFEDLAEVYDYYQ